MCHIGQNLFSHINRLMNNHLSKNILIDLITCWIIATIALSVGLLLNQLRDKPLPLIYQTKSERLGLTAANSEAPQTLSLRNPSISTELSLEEFKTFVDQKQGLVFDARPEIFHRFGHVPGALSLPRVDFESAYANIRYLLERDQNQKMVVYCADLSCEDSRLVQAALRKLGYAHVFVFREGWSAWSKARLPVEKAP